MSDILYSKINGLIYKDRAEKRVKIETFEPKLFFELNRLDPAASWGNRAEPLGPA